MRTRVFAVLAAGAIVSACATHIPEAANVTPGTPHVTWVLMYGDRDNSDREFSCQSDPPTECVGPPSRPYALVFANIPLYYHGAGAETRYEGTKNIEYLEGSPESRPSQTNIAVRKNEQIANESVTGIVTSSPGSYAVSLNLTATVVDTGRTHPIRQTIRVTVK